MAELGELGVALVRAANPGPITLSGTNTWIVGRDPAWVVDPGPALDAHLDAVAAELAARGGAGGIALTHDHPDHVDGLGGLLARLGEVPVGAARGAADVQLGDGDAFGPLRVLATPGHADDHLAFVAGRAAFTGDAVLGEGSVFVAGRLREYLAALRRLRELDLAVLCPGHGDPVWDARGRLDAVIAHREDREARLVAALERGVEDRDALLDEVWDDAPPQLRDFAALSLAAHLEKLREEGRA